MATRCAALILPLPDPPRRSRYTAPSTSGTQTTPITANTKISGRAISPRLRDSLPLRHLSLREGYGLRGCSEYNGQQGA